jgi:cytochrome c oxidase assembly protein Cox11
MLDREPENGISVKFANDTSMCLPWILQPEKREGMTRIS